MRTGATHDVQTQFVRTTLQYAQLMILTLIPYFACADDTVNQVVEGLLTEIVQRFLKSSLQLYLKLL